jgi:hypothetical protein
MFLMFLMIRSFPKSLKFQLIQLILMILKFQLILMILKFQLFH